eukprot:SAG22_NODE_18792_length_281_cov_0.901099_1_plen_64_part_10
MVVVLLLVVVVVMLLLLFLLLGQRHRYLALRPDYRGLQYNWEAVNGRRSIMEFFSLPGLAARLH